MLLYLIDIEKMSFEELCYKFPKVAIEKMSEDYKKYCEKAPIRTMGKCLFKPTDWRQPSTKESSNSMGQKPEGDPGFV